MNLLPPSGIASILYRYSKNIFSSIFGILFSLSLGVYATDNSGFKGDIDDTYFNIKNRLSAAVGSWEYVNSSDGSNPSARHECSYVEVNGKFYLLGGRGNPGTFVYEPNSNRWTQAANFPGNKELHHFQAVNYQGKIYILGAFTGGFPNESPVPDIYIYNPVTNSWSILYNQIPVDRRRGAAGAVVYNNKIYLIGGAKNGHQSGWVNYLDEFDPATLSWRVMSDAPHQRDHFQAAVINNKMYVAAGRRSNYPTSTYEPTEPTVDVFTFSSQSWTTLPSSSNLPTPRAGVATVVLNNELVVICGESGSNGYHREVQAFNPISGSWRTLSNTIQGRNGPGGVSYNGKIYIVNGMVNGNEVTSQEVYDGGIVVNARPYISKAITNVQVVKNTVSSTVSLSGVFNDDGGVASLKYTISSNSNTAIVTSATISGTTITLKYAPNVTGGSTIKVRAMDGAGLYAEADFVAQVTEPGAFSLLINSGGNAVNFNGQAWVADRLFSGGSGYVSTSAINGTTNDVVYQTERYGNFSYAIPVSSGTYTIKLHFSEIYWTAAGNRVFNVNIENGKGTLNNFDIYSLAGQNNMLVKQFPGILVTDGILNISFTSIKDNAKISGIEIIRVGISTPVNKAPVAKAGVDKTITLPVNSTTLNGSGTDADGTIKTYTWTQVSGPNTATFSSKTVAVPTISKLIKGVYSFSLTVTDDDNAKSAADLVTIIVNGSASQTQPASGLKLINAITDVDLMPLNNNSVINLAKISTSSVNIRMDVKSGVTFSKVEFNLTGKQTYSSSEGIAPFALYGDVHGNYNNWTITVGSYTLKATPYVNGTASTPVTINFNVISDASAARTISGATIQNDVAGYNDNPAFRITENVDLDMTVSPNPAVSSFNIRLSGIRGEKINLQVVDLQGRVIESRSDIQAGANLNIGSQFPKGVYYIHVMQGAGRIVRKVMKL